MCVCGYVPISRGAQGGQKRIVGFPGAEFTGSYEPPDVGAMTQTLILCNGRELVLLSTEPSHQPGFPFFSCPAWEPGVTKAGCFAQGYLS